MYLSDVARAEIQTYLDSITQASARIRMLIGDSTLQEGAVPSAGWWCDGYEGPEPWTRGTQSR